MIIQQKIGNLSSMPPGDKKIDWLSLEWFELPKRILRKKTHGGKEIAIKFLNNPIKLLQDDVIFQDDTTIIAIDVLPCDALAIRPKSMLEMASICYEIGNRHLPLFFEHDEVVVPDEAPLYRVLISAGFDVQRKNMKLLHPLQTSVAPHPHGEGTSLFSKIMQLTNSEQ